MFAWLYVRRAQVSGLMMSLMETFSPAYLAPLPLRGLCARACLNLVNNYRCGSCSFPLIWEGCSSLLWEGFFSLLRQPPMSCNACMLVCCVSGSIMLSSLPACPQPGRGLETDATANR